MQKTMMLYDFCGWMTFEKSPPAIQGMRFTRVVFGVSSSPFLFNATIIHHLNKYRDEHPESVEKFSLC